MNNILPKNSATLVRTSTIIHLALLSGQAMFAFVMFSLSEQTAIKFDNNDPFTFIVPMFALGSIFISILLFKTLINKAVKAGSLTMKLTGYQTAAIVRMALLESAGLFSIVTYYIAGNFLFLLIAIFLMIYGIVLMPTVENIADNLQLSYDEKMELRS